MCRKSIVLCDVLDQLYEEGLISGSQRSKSVYLTDVGIAKAETLVRKYLGGHL